MIQRIVKPPESHSFFLFGARGTGKSTLLKGNPRFNKSDVLWIDLLQPEEHERFEQNPSELTHRLKQDPKIRWVVIDEVQKCPKLLDLVHLHIEESKRNGKPILFALTGSSARKLRRGQANLLAGRAFLRSLYPLTHLELADAFHLEEVLHWGSLPQTFSYDKKESKIEYLNVYSRTFVAEEILAEQVVRNLPPFKKFLQVAAQSNGQILNTSKIGREVGVDYKTVQSYFQILEDTYVGFFLPAFHHSFRKSLSQKPKFYFFDLGVNRSLSKTLVSELVPNTFAYGNAFEHFVIAEVFRLNDYFEADFSLHYLRTKDDVEIDLVLQSHGKAAVFIEIKSSSKIREEDIKSFSHLAEDFPGKKTLYCFSQDPTAKRIGSVECLHWREGLSRLFRKG